MFVKQGRFHLSMGFFILFTSICMILFQVLRTRKNVKRKRLVLKCKSSNKASYVEIDLHMISLFSFLSKKRKTSLSKARSEEFVIKLRGIIPTESILSRIIVLNNNFLHWWHIISRHAIMGLEILLLGLLVGIVRYTMLLLGRLFVGVVHC